MRSGEHVPTVSVIIPTYNRAHLVGRAIRSVLAQTYQDWELIVVDDGSTDNSEEVVRGFSDPRIRYLRHETNRGTSAARNSGARAACGEYLTFLDSDDEMLPQMLERQVEIFLTHANGNSKLAAVMSAWIVVDDETGQTISQRAPLFEQRVRWSPSMLARQECLFEVGLWDEDLAAYERSDLNRRLRLKYEIVTVEAPLYVVHSHDGERVWNPGNRSKAIRVLLAKHPKLVRFAAGQMTAVGVQFLRNGKKEEARREFFCAIRLNPYRPSYYVYFLCSLAGRWALLVLNSMRKPGKTV